MPGLIFLVFAVIYIVRRPRIKALSPAQYTNVWPGEFERWRKYELMSIDIFLTGCLVPIVGYFMVAAVFVLGQSWPREVQDERAGLLMYIVYAGLGLFLAGLVVSAVYGSKAAAMRKRLGIELPR